MLSAHHELLPMNRGKFCVHAFMGECVCVLGHYSSQKQIETIRRETGRVVQAVAFLTVSQFTAGLAPSIIGPMGRHPQQIQRPARSSSPSRTLSPPVPSTPPLQLDTATRGFPFPTWPPPRPVPSRLVASPLPIGASLASAIPRPRELPSGPVRSDRSLRTPRVPRDFQVWCVDFPRPRLCDLRFLISVWGFGFGCLFVQVSVICATFFKQGMIRFESGVGSILILFSG